MSAAPFEGPLRVHPTNPRYFTDDSGAVRYLTGSHTWANLLDLKVDGVADRADFDYDAYLDMMCGHGHNFMRMWTYDHTKVIPWTDEVVTIGPMAFARVGPGNALDGEPRFDLTRWNDDYFTRLRRRVSAAGERGIYVAVMLFEGWCLKWAGPSWDPWLTHPYHRENNVNGVDGDPDRDGVADVYALASPDVLDVQDAYVRKVLETLNDLDNVLYEVINEIERTERGVEWHYRMIEFIQSYESTLPKQHPVGMSAEGGTQDNAILFAGPADWIAPGQGENRIYLHDPPDTEGRKVVIADTDHLWGHGGTYRWVWKSFTRGLNPIFMDPWGPIPGIGPPGVSRSIVPPTLNRRDYPDWEPLRRNLGATRRLADRIDLATMQPRPDLAASTFCLADPGRAYVVYVPDDAQVIVDLSDATGEFAAQWFSPISGQWQDAPIVTGGSQVNLVSPFGLDGVLHLSEVRSAVREARRPRGTR